MQSFDIMHYIANTGHLSRWKTRQQAGVEAEAAEPSVDTADRRRHRA